MHRKTLVGHLQTVNDGKWSKSEIGECTWCACEVFTYHASMLFEFLNSLAFFPFVVKVIVRGNPLSISYKQGIL